MTQVSIKDQLKKLVELQTIDEEIYKLKKILKEKPAYIEEQRQLYEAKKERLKGLEGKSKDVQVQRKSKETELLAKEEEIAKGNTQLSQLKTNKEYQAKIAEIEHMKADKSIIEEKILESYDESDKVTAQINEERGRLAEEEKKYLVEKKEIDDTIREIEGNLKVLETKRKQAIEGLEKSLLMRYERILENKDGLALVPIRGNACGGCYMNVPPQVINELKMFDKVIFCEMCSRILYIEEDL